MTHDGPSLLLEIFLAWLVSHLELFMSFLSPRLHPFLFHSFVMPSLCSLILDIPLDLLPHPFIVLCLRSWFCFYQWSPIGEGFWVCWFARRLPMSEWFDCRSCFVTLIFFLYVPWSSSIHVEWAMSSFHKLFEFIMCLASSSIWIHLVTYPNWIESFL